MRLYELLAGRTPFAGDSSSDVVAAILEREPDWRALPADTPEHIGRLIRHCLEKDKRLRLRDIGDALPDLAAPWVGPTRATPVTRRAVGGRAAIALVAVALAAGSLATWLFTRPASPGSAIAASQPVRFALPLPAGATRYGSGIEATNVSISPDGSTIAFVAFRPGAPGRIWMRRLDDDVASELPGTDGALSMFWSPDGRTLGFFAGGQLKRLDLPNGTPVKVCDVPINIGLSGTWGRQGDILFAAVGGDRISRVSAAGGEPVDAIVGSHEHGRASAVAQVSA